MVFSVIRVFPVNQGGAFINRNGPEWTSITGMDLKIHPKIHVLSVLSDFIWDFGKLPFPTHLGKYFMKIGKIRAKIHEIGKIKAIFGLGMTPIYGLKNGQIKSLVLDKKFW